MPEIPKARGLRMLVTVAVELSEFNQIRAVA
jgi:hypothetical protein